MARDDEVIAGDGVLRTPEFPVLRRVSDAPHRVVDEGGDLLVREEYLAGNLSAERDPRSLDLHFDGEPCHRVALQIMVEQIAGDEVGDFVRVTERYPFGSFKHWRSPRFR